MDKCIFCLIAKGEAPANKVWEDEEHLAFLSIFPNTDGVTVVIPKAHYDSYIFNVPEGVRAKLIEAAGKVAKVIDERLEDVGRTGMVFEGFGVNHLHAKLYPLHGTKPMKEWKPLISKRTDFYDRYPGFISSHDGDRADDSVLEKLAKKLRGEV